MSKTTNGIVIKKIAIFVVTFMVVRSFINRILSIIDFGAAFQFQFIVSTVVCVAAGLYAIKKFDDYRRRNGEVVENGMEFKEGYVAGNIMMWISIAVNVVFYNLNFVGWIYAFLSFMFNNHEIKLQFSGSKKLQLWGIVLLGHALYAAAWTYIVNTDINHGMGTGVGGNIEFITAAATIPAFIIGTMIYILRRQGFKFLPHIG